MNQKNKYSLRAVLFATTLSLSLFLNNPVFAQQEATDSASPTPATETTKNLRERIERIVDEKREQIRGALTELNQRKRAVIGEVTRVTAEAVTISNKDGTEIIPIDAAINIERGDKSIKLEEIAVGNWILAMGILEEDAFNPVSLSVSAESLRPRPRKVILGTITEVNRNDIAITPRGSEESINFDLLKETRYENIESEEIKLSDIEEETQALVVGFEEEDSDGEKTNEATTIRILTTVIAEQE